MLYGNWNMSDHFLCKGPIEIAWPVVVELEKWHKGYFRPEAQRKEKEWIVLDRANSCNVEYVIYLFIYLSHLKADIMQRVIETF